MPFNLFKRDPNIKAAKKGNRLIKVQGKGGIIQAKQARRISKINPSTGVITYAPTTDVDDDDDDDSPGSGGGAPPKEEKDNMILYGGIALAVITGIVLLRK